MGALNDALRVALKLRPLAAFGAGVLALALIAKPRLAMAFAIVAALNIALQFAFGRT